MVDVDRVIPDRTLSVRQGALAPLGKYRRASIFQQMEAVLIRYDADLDTPVMELPDEAIDEILYGSPVPLRLVSSSDMYNDTFSTFDGLVKYIQMQKDSGVTAKELRWAEQFSVMSTCPECGGTRLNKEALHYRLNGKNIHELASMDISVLYEWLSHLNESLTDKQRAIADEIVKLEHKTHIMAAVLRQLRAAHAGDFLAADGDALLDEGQELAAVRLADAGAVIDGEITDMELIDNRVGVAGDGVGVGVGIPALGIGGIHDPLVLLQT